MNSTRSPQAGLAVRLAFAFAGVAVATALAIALAAPPIVGRGFAAMQAAQTTGTPGASGGFGPGHGLGPGAGAGSPGAYATQLQTETTTTIIIVAVIAAAVASLLGLLIARRIARPLVQLEAAAASVARGNLATRSGLSSRGDEIGSLGRSFDAMATDLERGDTARRRFFQDAAHEMKTPLAVIGATAAAVMDGVYEHDERHLDTIRTQARLLERIVDDLRTISLAETGVLPLTRTSVPLADVVRTIGAAFEIKTQARGATFEARLPIGEALSVLADRDRLLQAVAAMVDNAIRYTPTGGRVTVTGGASPFSPEMARIEVLDDGPGVPLDELALVFDRFYQADVSRDRASGTSGLGLAIARAIAEAHGGHVGAANRPDGGAAFWVDIPRASAV